MVVRAVAACIVHDPRRCTLLREVGFMILNVTHYSEHCLFFKKKNPSQPLKITEPFVSVHSLQPQTPAVCLCFICEGGCSPGLPCVVWCQSSPAASITFLLSMFFTRILPFCCFVVYLLFLLFVCLRRDLR